jgi:hypothetical protein
VKISALIIVASNFTMTCLRSTHRGLCEGRITELDISKVEFNRKPRSVMQKIFNIKI